MNWKRIIFLMMIAAGALLLLGNLPALAQDGSTAEKPSGSPLHPTFPLMDADGKNVLESGSPVSTMQTCGSCHDTQFIAEHSLHADGALAAWGAVELTWQAGTTVEMNCFLCHTAAPDNASRIAALEAGKFEWANTATLASSGIVAQADGEWVWNSEAFDSNGFLLNEYVTMQDPRSENCGQCHGEVVTDAQTPLVVESCDTAQSTTLLTGQIFSPQRLSNSGMNLADKNDLSRSWDIHAERVVNCTDCHYALNNPVFYQETPDDRPDHMTFDPRRLDPGEYLYRPLHEFANGDSTDNTGTIAHENSSQPCQACHNLEENHEWLPYKDRHIQAVACESCHVPQLYAPALQTLDTTVLNADGQPRRECRGVEASGTTTLINGFEPVLLPRTDGDQTVLAPYNLVTRFYWVYGDPAQQVPLELMQAVYLDGDAYQADVLAAFDTNSDGNLDEAELRIDTEAKEVFMTARLEAEGLENPRIEGEVQPYSINHGVTSGEWAVRDCDTCHSDDSRINQTMLLADWTPGSTTPEFITDNTTGIDTGSLTRDGGALYYQPDSSASDFYVLGHDNVSWVDWLGALIFVGVLFGVLAHGGLRVMAARRMANHHKPEIRRVYMYSVYERQWHWLQTAVIFLLLFTGLVIHKPEIFGMFSFRGVVLVHNAMAAILLINAALAAFYHLASGEIRQFLPEPHGFLNDAFAQAMYYVRGIFRGEHHPFEKTPDRKMNPLQQMTYLGLLNVLLPAQVITGAMMWGAQHFPEIASDLGGLAFLAPLHTLVAWLFAAFIVAHVYLTTTGHEPLAGIKSMMMGWDEVEVHPAAPKESLS